VTDIGPYFDCDSHIVETLENLTRHQPKAFKDKYRLERRETPEGKYPWFLNGQRLEILEDATRPGNLIPKPGSLKEFLRALKDGQTMDVFVPAGPDVLTREGRLQHMHDTGVEASILYPGEVISMWPYFTVPADRLTLLHAFNEYLLDDWGFNYRDRLYGAPMFALDDLDAATHEATWLVEHGARVVLIPAQPAAGRSPADPYFDPVWAILDEARVVVAFHIGESEGTHSLLRAWNEKVTPARHSASAWFWMNAYGEAPLVHTISSIIYYNLFARFPNLKVLSVENGAEWVPHFLQKLDKSRGMAKGGTWPCGQLTDRPSNIFREHVGVVPYPEDDIAEIVAAVGPDTLCLGTDFPHPEGVARAQDFIDRSMKDLDDHATRRKLVYENARRFVPAGATNRSGG
jgi:predicted TIM-barrel fold metal-dependent hydrolase